MPARVLIVGAGGLGCPAAIRLVSQGVSVTLVDDDVVDETNLARQILFTDADVGTPKVEAAARALRLRFPDVEIATLNARLSRDDRELVSRHAVMLDGTDNFPTRFAANALSVATRVSLVHGAAIGWQGQLLTVLPRQSACLACIFESEPPPGAAPTCAEAGVIAPLVGIIGGWMADEALALLSGSTPETVDAMRVFDASTGARRLARVGRDPRCAVCQTERASAEQENARATPDASIDVSTDRCPMTWVRTKLALERLESGRVLEVVLGAGEMLDNVPKNAREDGFFVDGPESIGVDRHRILIRRGN